MKTLIFEGAGWEGGDTSRGTDVTNCRIRTRIRNNKGRVIYLEMGCRHFDKKTKHIPKYAEGLNYATHIDSVHYDDAKWDKRACYSSSLSPFRNIYFEYNKTNILKYVNENLDCSFDNMIVYNENEMNVFDTEEPLCNCSNGDYKPFKDIENNINELDSVKPIVKWDRHNQANYRISYNSLLKLPYMKRHIEEQNAQNNTKVSKDGKYMASFRWDENGIITSLELHCACCMSVGAEDVEKIINLIKKE